jgi:membrane protein YqaA with SNARE-associated domain
LLHPLVLTIARPAAANHLLSWLRHLGGVGLIFLGLLDNSIVPLPGSMDVFLVVLCADQREWWPYYTLMATTGSLIGGYLTYRLARGEGRGRLAKRLNTSQMEKVHQAFKKWGFLSIAVPALVPPPFPMTPFLVAAGAAQYPRNRFLGALFLGRGIRYTILGILSALYGGHLLTYLSQHTRVWVWVMIGLALFGGAFAFFRFRHRSSDAA